MAFPSIATLWSVVQKVDRILALEEKQSQSVAKLQDQIDALSARLDRLEAREEIVVAKAEGAARAAASASATIAIADLARRLGGLEERTRRANSRSQAKSIDAPKSRPASKTLQSRSE